MTSPSQLDPSAQDLSGRTVVITGANSGIGLATARALAGRGARVVLAVRNVDKGAAAARSIDGTTEVRALDLSDLGSVRRFAEDWEGSIDVLVNNAGISSPTLVRTRDGFELQFATNHLGPFALTNLLLSHISRRVVSLSSQAERAARIDWDDLGWEHTAYRESRAYANSKLANLLFVNELQRRLTAAGSAVTAAAAHPGLVDTAMTAQTTGVARLIVRLLAQSPADGALPVLMAATEELPGASFTGPRHLLHMRGGAQLIGRSRQARDPALARRLWEISEALTGVRFAV